MFMWSEILPLHCLQHILLLLTHMLKTCYRSYLKSKVQYGTTQNLPVCFSLSPITWFYSNPKC